MPGKHAQGGNVRKMMWDVQSEVIYRPRLDGRQANGHAQQACQFAGYLHARLHIPHGLRFTF
jgi:hypothetical protein